MTLEQEKNKETTRERQILATGSVQETIFSGFSAASRRVILSWQKRFVHLQNDPQTARTLRSLNNRLFTGDAIIFFDHHHAFDVIPAALMLAEVVETYGEVLIPYAIFLEMGINARGAYSVRHHLRTRAFFWFIEHLKKNNPTIHLYPMVREFELHTPGIRKALDEHHQAHNIAFIKKLSEMYRQPTPGNLSILAPMAGLAFPERAPLNPDLYRIIGTVQKKRNADLPVYFVGAYSHLVRKYQYILPILNRHTFVARGPFYLPSDSYGKSLQQVRKAMDSLRKAGDFFAPDYDIIRTHSK